MASGIGRASAPPGTLAVSVGGALLGGSGKTPVATCTATILSGRATTAFVGHGYGGRLDAPRAIDPSDDVADVGDEAIVARRALAPGVRVVVGGRKKMGAAIALAAEQADAVVVDGAFFAPSPLALRLLAIDSRVAPPTGVPPVGDLRAPLPALLATIDLVVFVRDDAPSFESAWRDAIGDVRSASITRVSRGAYLAGRLVPFADLAPLRVGLVTSLGRPARLVRSLRARGVRPAVVVHAPDHRPPRSLRGDVDLWIATPKCALHLATFDNEIGVLEDAYESDPLAHALASMAPIA